MKYFIKKFHTADMADTWWVYVAMSGKGLALVGYYKYQMAKDYKNRMVAVHHSLTSISEATRTAVQLYGQGVFKDAIIVDE